MLSVLLVGHSPRFLLLVRSKPPGIFLVLNGVSQVEIRAGTKGPQPHLSGQIPSPSLNWPSYLREQLLKFDCEIGDTGDN
jgi:hypothetical protein